MNPESYPLDIREKIIAEIKAGEISKRGASKKYGMCRDTLDRWLRRSLAPPQDVDAHSHRNQSRLLIHQERKESTDLLGKRIAVIPDMQVKPGIDLSYCRHIGLYLADKRPDIIINGGDFADMPSLSSYELLGSKGMEGQRYKEDILSVQTAMKMMMEPIIAEGARTGWKPELILTLGNHENRIERAINATPKLDGVIGLSDLHYEEYGWKVVPFLEPIVIEGIAFAHYFCSGIMGRPITSARALLTKKHMSCFAFHQQGRDIAFGTRADGTQMIGIIAGSCYPHDEAYLNPQTNNHWRGLYILNDVIDGAFEENAVSLKYLKRKHGA